MSEPAPKPFNLFRLRRRLRLALQNVTEGFVRLPLLAKGPAVILLGLGIGTGANLINHNAYWNYTIYSVQTVDFNILANVLPAAAREPLLNRNKAELRRLLDSNYSLFGIVLSICEPNTECSSERFIASSGFSIEDDGSSIRLIGDKPWSLRATRAWTGILKDKTSSREEFINHLKHNESVDKQGVYANSNEPDFTYELTDNRKRHTKKEGNDKSDKIGNLYFVRNTIPPFADELKSSLGRLFRIRTTTLPAFLSTRQGVILQTYLGSVLLALFIWAVFELMAARYKYAQQLESVALQEQKLKFFRIKYSADLFSSQIDSFSHDLKTASQRVVVIMNDLALRTCADMRSIVHDMKKAPLIRSRDNFDELINLLRLSSYPPDQDSAEIIDKLKTTYNQLNFVVSDMRSASSTGVAEVLDINRILEQFEHRLPPIQQDSPMTLRIDRLPQPAFIIGNEWHILSIIRNVYYNSLAAAIEKTLDLPRNERDTFIPEMVITPQLVDNCVEVVIKDNGPGIPEDKLKTLYQWLPSSAANLEADRESGHGSDIVATYIMLNNASVRVANLLTPDGAICGAKVVLRFKLTSPTS